MRTATCRAGSRPASPVRPSAPGPSAGSPGRWGVYKGEITIEGSRLMGYIACPPRDKVPLGRGVCMITVNLGRPRALLIAIDQATYKPTMQEPYDWAVSRAVDMIRSIMEAELANAIVHQAAQASRRAR